MEEMKAQLEAQKKEAQEKEAQQAAEMRRIEEEHAAKVKELGGTVMVPPTPAGEMGRFSVVQDPQGGGFTIMETSGPVDPPPGYES